MRAAFAFASDARKNVALTWFSYSKRGATAGNKALAFLIVGGVISELLRTMWRDFRDDEDDEFLDEKNWGDPMRFIAAGLTDWMYGVPVLGETAERTINAALGIHTFDRGGIFGPVKSVVPALKRTPDTVADLLSGDADWGEVMRDANAILTAMGLFNNQIAALAVLSNPAKDAMQAADAQLGPDE
jgi:hypothetical protein